MRRMIQVAGVVVAGVGVWVASGSASAQSLKPAPEAGSWQVRNQLLVNGKDVLAEMRKAQLEALKNLPTEQRAQAEALLEKSAGEGERECLTAKDLEGWSDPRQRLAQMERDAPSCKFDLDSINGPTLKFKGRCSQSDGFTGEVTGGMTMTSARAWTASYTGKGRMADVKVGNKVEPGAPVEIKSSATGSWLGAECGK
jgi:vacuolar-type H+-ATPase subunit E/Vma4